MYCDNHFCFQGDEYINFHSLINFVHGHTTFHWMTNFNIGTNHLIFELVGHHI